MNKNTLLFMIIICFAFTPFAHADTWHVVLVPQGKAASLPTPSQHIQVQQIINEAFYQKFKEVNITTTAADTVFERCDKALCGFSTIVALLEALEQKQLSINLLVLFELNETTRDGKTNVTLRVRAIDTVSGVVSFSNVTSTQIPRANPIDLKQTEQLGSLEVPLQQNWEAQTLLELAQRNSQQLALQISTAKKRYVYKLRLTNFTPQEIDTFTGIATSASDNVKTRLIDEQTHYHFMRLLLPSKNITFELSTHISPSQFREQMSTLFKRMNVDVSSRFIQQDNLFVTRRSVSAYSLQLSLLWAIVGIVLVCTFYLLTWYFVQRKLDCYASTNHSAKWVALVKTAKFLPFPFLCKAQWQQELSYWEKRISQGDIWFDNAHQLLQNHEIESANVFVKKSLEDNASNIAAQALETAIEEQLSKHQVIEDEREKFKGFVVKSVALAQAGELLKALEQAYTALYLCESHAKLNRPVIDLQIDSTKNLIKRISRGKAYACAGLTLSSSQQNIMINCGNVMRIGRAESQFQSQQELDITLPQDTLSRLHKSITIERQENAFIAKDLGSANGLWLQYHLCTIQKDYRLAQMDQLHLSPPDELGTIGFQVRHLEGNKSIALSLCQNAILPSVNLASSKSFINPSEYASHSWYLSREAFYLVFSFEQFVWLSESEWLRKQSQKETHGHYEEILKVEINHGVYLHPISRSHEISLGDIRILGPVPVPLESQLRVNNNVFDIRLFEKIDGDQVKIDSTND